MLYHLQAVRDNIRNREGARVFYLGKDDRLTEDARDYLKQEGIPILPAQEAKPQSYRLAGGGYVTEKPEHMTHLNGEVLVSKTHPRIAFRGQLDLLQAQLLLCQRKLSPPLRQQLEEILALCRRIIRCDVLEQPLEQTLLCGLTPQQLRQRSHLPQKYYDQPHFMPQWTDPQTVLELNLLRSMVRQAELAAVTAFQDREGNPTRTDLLQAMNRMSSMLYLLMIQCKARPEREEYHGTRYTDPADHR